MLIIFIKKNKKLRCVPPKKEKEKKSYVSHGHLCYLSDGDFPSCPLLAKEHFLKVHFITHVHPQHPVE